MEKDPFPFPEEGGDRFDLFENSSLAGDTFVATGTSELNPGKTSPLPSSMPDFCSHESADIPSFSPRLASFANRASSWPRQFAAAHQKVAEHLTEWTSSPRNDKLPTSWSLDVTHHTHSTQAPGCEILLRFTLGSVPAKRDREEKGAKSTPVTFLPPLPPLPATLAARKGRKPRTALSVKIEPSGSHTDTTVSGLSSSSSKKTKKEYNFDPETKCNYVDCFAEATRMLHLCWVHRLVVGNRVDPAQTAPIRTALYEILDYLHTFGQMVDKKPVLWLENNTALDALAWRGLGASVNHADVGCLGSVFDDILRDLEYKPKKWEIEKMMPAGQYLMRTINEPKVRVILHVRLGGTGPAKISQVPYGNGSIWSVPFEYVDYLEEKGNLQTLYHLKQVTPLGYQLVSASAPPPVLYKCSPKDDSCTPEDNAWLNKYQLDAKKADEQRLLNTTRMVNGTSVASWSFASNLQELRILTLPGVEITRVSDFPAYYAFAALWLNDKFEILFSDFVRRIDLALLVLKDCTYSKFPVIRSLALVSYSSKVDDDPRPALVVHVLLHGFDPTHDWKAKMEEELVSLAKQTGIARIVYASSLSRVNLAPVPVSCPFIPQSYVPLLPTPESRLFKSVSPLQQALRTFLTGPSATKEDKTESVAQLVAMQHVIALRFMEFCYPAEPSPLPSLVVTVRGFPTPVFGHAVLERAFRVFLGTTHSGILYDEGTMEKRLARVLVETQDKLDDLRTEMPTCLTTDRRKSQFEGWLRLALGLETNEDFGKLTKTFHVPLHILPCVTTSLL